MIEGDNLEVLKLLQRSYAGKVKLIYIDPPYNRDADVIYRDDYSDGILNYQILTGQVESDGRKLTSVAETSGRFHTDWMKWMNDEHAGETVVVFRDSAFRDDIGKTNVAAILNQRGLRNIRSL